MKDLKTKESLLSALRHASTHKPTVDELKRQRVSFIMGSLKADSSVTRARVEQVLAMQEGKGAA